MNISQLTKQKIIQFKVKIKIIEAVKFKVKVGKKKKN